MFQPEAVHNFFRNPNLCENHQYIYIYIYQNAIQYIKQRPKGLGIQLSTFVIITFCYIKLNNNNYNTIIIESTTVK